MVFRAESRIWRLFNGNGGGGLYVWTAVREQLLKSVPDRTDRHCRKLNQALVTEKLFVHVFFCPFTIFFFVHVFLLFYSTRERLYIFLKAEKLQIFIEKNKKNVLVLNCCESTVVCFHCVVLPTLSYRYAVQNSGFLILHHFLSVRSLRTLQHNKGKKKLMWNDRAGC